MNTAVVCFLKLWIMTYYVKKQYSILDLIKMKKKNLIDKILLLHV